MMGREGELARRPLALFERAMYVDGQQPVNVLLVARVRGELDEFRLYAALARLQARHPVLRCLIEQVQGRAHFVEQATPPPIPLQILARGGEEDWIELAGRELQQRFDGSVEPLCRLLWLRGDRDSELVLICHHAICDGRSMLNLLGQILRLHAEPLAELGAPARLTAIDSVFPAEVIADRALQRRIRWRVRLLKSALRLLPISRRRWHYGEVYQHFWRLDAAPSQRLLARCKSEGVGPAAAFTAAFMLAFAAAHEGRAIDKFVLPVDVRRFLPALDADGLFAIAPTVALPALKKVAVEPSAASFWHLARTIKQSMDVQIEGLAGKVYRDFLGMERLHDLYPRMLAYAQSRRAGGQVSLSYVGRVPIAPRQGELELRGVPGLSAILTPTPANLIVISSFGGQFDFSLASDQHSLPRTAALSIVERAMTVLQAAAWAVPEPTTIDAEAPQAAPVESL